MFSQCRRTFAYTQRYLLLAASVIRGSQLSGSISEPAEKRKQVLTCTDSICGLWRARICDIGLLSGRQECHTEVVAAAQLVSGGWESTLSASFEGHLFQMCLVAEASCSLGGWRLELVSKNGIDLNSVTNKLTQEQDLKNQMVQNTIE